MLQNKNELMNYLFEAGDELERDESIAIASCVLE